MSRKQALEAKIDQIKAALFDSLISDCLHGGGGGGSKLPWRGRDKDEDDIAWARRCAMQARKMLKPASGSKRKR